MRNAAACPDAKSRKAMNDNQFISIKHFKCEKKIKKSKLSLRECFEVKRPFESCDLLGNVSIKLSQLEALRLSLAKPV